MGKEVCFLVKHVNEVCVLLDTDMANIKEKGCKIGIWMVTILCLDREVSWAATKWGISVQDFTVEGRIKLKIIYKEFFHANIWIPALIFTHMVACIMFCITLNMGKIMHEK